MDADDRLGPWLRRLRHATALTQEELAERAGISARTVSDVERGLRTVVHQDTALRLASALELTGERRRAFEALARGREPRQSAEPAVGRLPQVPTALLGRSREVAAVCAALEVRDVRLLTLTGPGGIGKTRLAVEAARRAQRSFPDGIFFVSLGEVTDAALVGPEVAKAIGVVTTDANLQALMTRRLKDQRSLIVLDTFEHLAAATPLVYALMLGAPKTTFLVTSRSALRVRGEHQFPVPPLELPPEGADLSLEQVVRWPATALFWDRALAVRPDLQLDAGTARLVVDVCRQVDGLPLAIELAAARVGHLPLQAMRDQLQHRLRLLVGGPLDLPHRQRAIQDAVAWSHDLLGPREATLFRRLSVFSGGWSLRAAAEVCWPDDDVGDALEGVSALVDQSLVLLDRDHPDGRYGMLHVVRDYAAQRLLEAGEADAVARRHALHYLGLAEEAEPNLVRAGHADWFRRLDIERGNLRGALAWTMERGEAVLALRYTVALWRYWRQFGKVVEGRRWTDAALRVPGEAPVSLRAKALWAAGALAYPQSDDGRLAELTREAIDIARRSEDPMDLRNALTMQGFVAQREGRHHDARSAFQRCVAICRRLGPSWHLATSYLNLGTSLLVAGHVEQADAAFEQGLGLYRQFGDENFAARMLNQRAQCALARNDVERAGSLAREALATFAEHSERQGVAESLETLAAVAAVRSDADLAATLAGAVDAIREANGLRPLPDVVINGRYLDAAARAAGQERWRPMWEAGRLLTPEAAVSRALER